MSSNQEVKETVVDDGEVTNTETKKPFPSLVFESLRSAFTPNAAFSQTQRRCVAIVSGILLYIVWQWYPQTLIPRPGEVLNALGELWSQGLLAELISSVMVQIKAIVIATIISLLLSYSIVLEACRPLVILISKWRFIGLGALVVFFSQMTGGSNLKILLLVLGMSVFYVTAMMQIVMSIPTDEFDHARTLGYGEWQVIWEVIILGKRDVALEMLRQNAAMGWMMLTMVEGLVRSGGGIGVMILNETKHFRLSHIFTIVIILLIVGLLQDFILWFIRNQLCPYADLKATRR